MTVCTKNHNEYIRDSIGFFYINWYFTCLLIRYTIHLRIIFQWQPATRSTSLALTSHVNNQIFLFPKISEKLAERGWKAMFDMKIENCLFNEIKLLCSTPNLETFTGSRVHYSIHCTLKPTNQIYCTIPRDLYQILLSWFSNKAINNGFNQSVYVICIIFS